MRMSKIYRSFRAPRGALTSRRKSMAGNVLIFASLTILLTGCSSATEDPQPTSPPTSTASSDADPSPSTLDATPPEPTPSFSWDGVTRTLTYGNVTITATPAEAGVKTVVRVTNTGAEEAAFQVEVSVKAGGEVSSHRFWLQSVPPGETGEQDATLAGQTRTDDLGKPEIYLDALRRIG
jgi:hypothetical protein